MAACNEGQTAVEDSMASVDRETSTIQEDQDKDKNERRMILFRKIMDKFLNKIMSTGRQSHFKSSFKEIRAQNPGALDSITEQLMNHLRSNIETEISLMIKQEDLEYFLDTLDHTVDESSSRSSPAWRPSGEPSTDCRDHLMAVKCTFRDQMKEMLEKIENENKALEEVILPRRERVEENQILLSQKAQHLTEAAKFCQDFDVSRLQEQTKAILNE